MRKYKLAYISIKQLSESGKNYCYFIICAYYSFHVLCKAKPLKLFFSKLLSWIVTNKYV